MQEGREPCSGAAGARARPRLLRGEVGEHVARGRPDRAAATRDRAITTLAVPPFPVCCATLPRAAIRLLLPTRPSRSTGALTIRASRCAWGSAIWRSSVASWPSSRTLPGWPRGEARSRTRPGTSVTSRASVTCHGVTCHGATCHDGTVAFGLDLRRDRRGACLDGAA